MKKEKNKNLKNELDKDNELDEKIIKDLLLKIEDLEKKNKDVFSGWQRTEADFLNYKNKENERLENLSFYIKKDILEELLPILDNFDLAERMIPEDKKNDNNIKGLLMIKKQLGFFLKSVGIEEIESLGKIFNLLYNEVVEEIDGEEKDSGLIIEEVQKGYMLNGKVLRPSKVKIIK
jgi:molecular chaperone GrpE